MVDIDDIIIIYSIFVYWFNSKYIYYFWKKKINNVLIYRVLYFLLIGNFYLFLELYFCSCKKINIVFMKDSIDFGNMEILRLFRKLLILIVFGMVFFVVFVIIDGIFVGKGIGSDVLVVVNIMVLLFMIIIGIGLMFGVGVFVVVFIYLL